MGTVIAHPPRTIKEVFELLPEGTLAQLIENNLIISPTPLDVHQKVLGRLFIAIGNFVELHQLGEVRVAPYDVYLDGENVFQPDITFVSKERCHLIKANGLHGAPDLVIELLSPSTAKYDNVNKKAVYERHGVKEYWIVKPSTREASCFKLIDGQFMELPSTTGVLRSAFLQSEFVF